MTNQKKISKGDVVLAKDLTGDYWGSEIEYSTEVGIKYTMVLKKHRAMNANTIIDLFPEGGANGFSVCAAADTEITILTPPWGRHPEKPTEMGTIIQIEGAPSNTFVVDYYGDILSLFNASHFTWDSVKGKADMLGARIILSKPTASYDDGLTDIETRDDWDPSKEELYRTRQWRDVVGNTWSSQNGVWGYFRRGDGVRVPFVTPAVVFPLRLVPKDEEVS